MLPLLLAAAGAVLGVQALALASAAPGLLWLPRGIPRGTWPLLGVGGCAAVAGAVWLGGGGWIWPAAGFTAGIPLAVVLASMRPLHTEQRWLCKGGDGAHSFHASVTHLSDGSVALLFEPVAPPPASPRATVVLCHGGGNDRLYGLWYLIERLTEAGHRVVTAHLPGHGRGGEDPFGLQACRDRTDVLVRWAREAVEEPVVLIGQSMGAAVVLDRLARCSDLAAAVTVSAPHELRVGSSSVNEALGLLQPHIYRALRYANPFEALPAAGGFKRGAFPVRTQDGRSYLREFERCVDAMQLTTRLPLRPDPSCPVLLIHGDADGVIPVQQARDLGQALGSAAHVEIVEGMTHLDPTLRRSVMTTLIHWLHQQLEAERAQTRQQAKRLRRGAM